MSMLTTYYGFFDYWQLYHKVTFDPLERLVIINDGVTELNVQRDIYSASKEWLKQENNLRFKRPMRAAGGDPIPGGGQLGSTFFMTNGWRIQVNAAVTIDGNLYSDDFTSPFVVPEGINIVRSKFSNLVDTANVTVPTAQQNAAAVWSALLAEFIASGTAAKMLADIEKKTDDNQALIISK